MASRIWIIPPYGTHRVPRSQRKYALIDDEDSDRISKYDWFIQGSATTLYAATNSARIGKNQRRMHRLVLGASVDETIDHINGNGLDNRRENLRVVTASQNQQNRYAVVGQTSKFKGVHWSDDNKRWIAQLRIDGEPVRAGIFTDERAAARAYDKEALRLFGEHARTNAMMGLFGEDIIDPRMDKLTVGDEIKAPLLRGPEQPYWAEYNSDRVKRDRRLSNAIKRSKERADAIGIS